MSSRLKNFLWLVAVLVVFTLITSVRGQTGVSINFGDDTLDLTGPNQFSCSIEYDKIKSLSLIELTEIGEPVNGDSNRRYQWGTYANDAWGEYTLCISKKIESALLITLQTDDHVVFNFESEDTTTALLDMFNDLLESHKTGGDS